MLSILEIALLAFVLNIPFGYLRSHSKKFSLKWWMCVHIPVPLVVAARFALHANYQFIPLFILAAVAGQFIGGKISFKNDCKLSDKT